MIDKALSLILTKISEQRQAQVDALSAGRAGDFPDYRHICGTIRGLDLSESIVKDLVQRLEKSDE